MGAVSIQQMADRVAALMEDRLGLRGDGLAAKTARARRILPRRLHEAATRLAEAAHMSQNPRLLLQVDREKVAADYDALVRHLGGLSRWDRRRAWAVQAAGSVGMALLAAGAVAAALMWWRGLL